VVEKPCPYPCFSVSLEHQRGRDDFCRPPWLFCGRKTTLNPQWIAQGYVYSRMGPKYRRPSLCRMTSPCRHTPPSSKHCDKAQRGSCRPCALHRRRQFGAALRVLQAMLGGRAPKGGRVKMVTPGEADNVKSTTPPSPPPPQPPIWRSPKSPAQ
jgi:hypothetical protein